MDFDDEALLAEAEASDTRGPSPSPPAELTTAAPPLVAPLKQSTLTFGTLQPASYLPALNEAQRKAVTAPAAGSLQILAGPGSGKTKVLTTRVAYLLQHYKLDPEELVVVTFTNKAANEMKVRLSVIVGAATVDKLMMGTFHSVCVRYLRKYGKLIGLANNFIIADRDDCLAMIKRCIISSSMPEDLRKDLKPSTLLDVISKCKTSEMSPALYRAQQAAMDNPQSAERMEAICRVYEDYEAELARDRALDFDDLLLRGLHLLQRFPRVVSKVKNVLIDEFQDTNGTQYSLVKLIAKACQSLTIVGDPDQSIYGWRNADVENLEKMVNDFAPVEQIFLEENYRSTGAILGAALAVVRQDTKRINKGLKATHTAGSSVVLHCAPNAFDEASFIAAQIKHLIAHGGGLINYGDVAILLRYGALSRVIEVALQKSGIPSRMVGGHKFFDRTEVKDVLSYLQLVDNPSYTAAFSRVINVPKRGIGEKTTREMLNIATKKGWTAWDVAVKLAKGSGVVNVTSTQRKGMRDFVMVVSEMRAAAEDGKSVPDLIDFLCEKVAYKAFLDKTQGPDAEERWMNVEELKAYATVVAEENPEGLVDEVESDIGDMEEVDIPLARSVGEDEDDEDYLEIIEDNSAEDFPPVPSSQPTQSTNALRTFLAVSMLATDTETSDAKADKLERKVTLSTVHAAKGLEWAVVFVPACENGTFPFYRSESPNEIDEERRLLYVAITRAQGFCTLSHSMTRMIGANVSKKDLSPFLSTVSKAYPTLFVKRLQKIGTATRLEMARVLGRPAPSEELASQLIKAYNDSRPENPPTYEYIPPSASQDGGFPRSQGAFSNGRVSGGSYQSWGGSNSSKINGSMGQWSNDRAPAAIPVGAASGFSSALSNLRSTTAEQVAPIPSSSVKPRNSRPRDPLADQSRLSFSRTTPAPPLSTTGTDDDTEHGDDDPFAPLTSRPAPPLRRPSQQNGFKLPRPSSTAAAPLVASTSRVTAPAPKRPPPTSTSTTRLPFSRPRMNPPPSGPPLHPQGLPNVPETRHSKISDAVLVNPKVGEGVPSDLLERWSSKEQERLTEIRGLGEGMGRGSTTTIGFTGGAGLGKDGLLGVAEGESPVDAAGDGQNGSGGVERKRLSEGQLQEAVGQSRKKRKGQDL